MVPHRPTQGNDPLLHSATLACGRATAQADVAVAADLAELLALAIPDWPARGFVRTKERTVRSVFAGVLDAVPVHVKVFRPDTLADHVRDLLRPSRGRREADNLRRALALGLPVVPPLAHGHAWDGERLCSFVVTRTVDGSPFDFRLAPEVLARGGVLLRRLHDLGVRLGDLHPGNLLVDADGNLHLLDLTTMSHGGDLDLVQRSAALAFFCQDLDAGALDPRAKSLLAGYLAAGTMPITFTGELMLATRRWRAAALPAFGRRASRNCKHTQVSARQRGQPRWHWHLPGDSPARRALCEQFAVSPPTPSKTGRRGSVWLLADIAVKEREAAKARKLWRASYWLLFARVPIAPPIALRLHGGRGQVFAARLTGPPLAAELAHGHLATDAIRAAAGKLGHAIGRLHAHGLGNRDLKLDNLVRDPVTGDVAMVDLDGVRRRGADETRGRGADIGRLLAAFRAAGAPGGTGTLRAFLRAYIRAHRQLLQTPPLRRVLRAAEQRAGEWASAHR